MSSATGIIGLQQNPSTQKNALVGELNLQLQNTWQKNEKFNLHWRSIAPQTQQLKTSLLWPYIAGSSYGLASGFSLYKRDSTFLELRANMGLTYLLAKNWQYSTCCRTEFSIAFLRIGIATTTCRFFTKSKKGNDIQSTLFRRK